MLSIWLSTLLYGFVQPGSKWLMQDGLGVLPFCLLYVGIRLLIQFPFVFKTGAYRIQNFAHFRLLLAFGIVGAFVQLAEFMGIAAGLPVPLVSFLVYSHPVWTLVLAVIINQEPFPKSGFIKIVIATAGIALLTEIGLEDLGSRWELLLWPLSGGFLLAFWICLSSLGGKRNYSPQGISFYYDLFSFILLFLMTLAPPNLFPSLLFLSGPADSLKQVQEFFTHPLYGMEMILFSVLIGLLPNYLFYSAASSVPAFQSGLILLLQPVIASLVSWIIWKDKLSSLFILGAVLILVTSLPVEAIRGNKRGDESG